MAESFPQEMPSNLIPTHPGSIASEMQTGPTDDPLHELRVRIPVDLHRQLLSLKVLRGKSLAETVSTALDIYFAEHSRQANLAVASDPDAARP